MPSDENEPTYFSLMVTLTASPTIKILSVCHYPDNCFLSDRKRTQLATDLEKTPNRIHTVRKSPHFVDPINELLPRIMRSAGRQRENPKNQKQKSNSIHF